MILTYKPIINRNCKDQTWINSFCESKLEGKSRTEFFCTDKMIYAIGKNGRQLERHLDKFSTQFDILFYNEKYFLKIDTNKNKAILIDIVKYQKESLQYELNKARNENKWLKGTMNKIEKKIILLNCFLSSQELPFPNFTKEEGRKLHKDNLRILQIEQIKKNLCELWDNEED